MAQNYEEMRKAFEEAPRVGKRAFYEAEKALKDSIEQAAKDLKVDKGRVEIYDFGCGLTAMKMGVNWSAIGTTSPEGTRAYAELLIRAAELAENFIYNGYVVDYSKD